MSEENDFGFSKTKASSLIDKVKTDVEIQEMKEKGATYGDVVGRQLFGKNDEHRKSILDYFVFASTMVKIGESLQRDYIEFEFSIDYSYVVQGYIEHLRAVKVADIITDIHERTVEDFLEKFVQSQPEFGTIERFFAAIPGSDVSWFMENVAPCKLGEVCYHLAFNEKDFLQAKKTREETIAKEAETQKKIKEAFDLPYEEGKCIVDEIEKNDHN